jgi:hypothetical protein
VCKDRKSRPQHGHSATAPQTLAKRTVQVSSVLAVFPRTLLGYCINYF